MDIALLLVHENIVRKHELILDGFIKFLMHLFKKNHIGWLDLKRVLFFIGI